jgi:protein-disulfide isomerase
MQKVYPVIVIVLVFFLGYFYSKSTATAPRVQGVQQAGAQPTLPPEPTPDLSAMPAVTDKDHIQGSKDAPVVLVEYSDFECPFCKQFHPTMEQVMKEYGDKVAWVYRHYPLPFHANAQKEAEASECVAELGGNDKFWQFGNTIYERTTSNGTGFALANLGPLAAEVGVDQSAFQSCLDSGKYASLVATQAAGGQKAGVNGTPGTIIIGKNGTSSLVPGALPFDQVKPMIEAALK